jgi:ParB family chromosome partitioning protein
MTRVRGRMMEVIEMTKVLENIKLDKIDLNDYNPDQRSENLDSLIDSVSRDGLLQSILVRPVRDRYEVVYGTRRLLSLRALGRTEALCTVEEMDRQRAMRLAFSENNERVNLSPVDEAVYFGQMLGVTDEQIFSAGHPRNHYKEESVPAGIMGRLNKDEPQGIEYRTEGDQSASPK